MSLTLLEGDFASFFETPFRIYGEGSPYVSPMRSDLARYLDPAQNPLMRDGGALSYFTALRDGAPVGRITAHVHPASNARYGWKRAYFGYFDVADNAQAAALLLDQVRLFALAHGCDEIVGAFNLTAMQQLGVLTEGFEGAPYTDMVWSPPYLARLLEENGFAATFPVSTFELDLKALDPDVLLGDKARAILADPAWTFAAMERKRFKAQLEEARDCLNDGFYDNPMFVPLTSEEFAFQAGEMMWILDPDIAAIAHHEGEPAGVVICIPDLNPFVRSVKGRFGPGAILRFLKHRWKRDRAVIILYSVKQPMQGRGLNAAMLWRVMTALKARGYKTCGVTWIADSNTASLRQMDKLGARRLHRLNLFRRAVA